jgi:hypothetical protein
MAPKTVIGIGSAALIVSGLMTRGSSAQEEMSQHKRSGCNEATLRGTYGAQMQGTNPVPPALGGGIQTVIGVVLRTYDGAGGFTQVDNVKGSITGIVPDRPGAGTYQVNADCTGVTVFQPAPGITLEERMVIVDRGDEIRTIVSSPLSVMVSTVQRRINHR